MSPHFHLEANGRSMRRILMKLILLNSSLSCFHVRLVIPFPLLFRNCTKTLQLHHDNLTGWLQESLLCVCISWLRAINRRLLTVCLPLICISAPAEIYTSCSHSPLPVLTRLQRPSVLTWPCAPFQPDTGIITRCGWWSLKDDFVEIKLKRPLWEMEPNIMTEVSLVIQSP